MAAPPGFDPTSSVLPDPGASSAPIHVMRGGGMKGGARENILRAYELGPGQELSSKFSEKEKEAFVEALKSGGCNWSAKSVLDAKCAPVVNVLKALLGQKIKSVNAVDIPEDVGLEKLGRPFPNLSRLGRPTTIPAGKGANAGTRRLFPLGRGDRKAPLQPISTSVTPVSVADVPITVIDEEEVAVEASGPSSSVNSGDRVEGEMAANAVEHNIEYNPRNYRGSNSDTLGALGFNFEKRKMYANVKLGTRRARIRGNSDENITAAYNAEKGRLNTEAADARVSAETAAAEKKRLQNEANAARRAVNTARAAKKEAERKAYATARARGNTIPLASRLIGRVRTPARAPAAAAAGSKWWNPFKSGGRRTRKGARKSRRVGSRKSKRNTRRGNRK